MNITATEDYQLGTALRIVAETFPQGDRRNAAYIMIGAAAPQDRVGMAQDLCDALVEGFDMNGPFPDDNHECVLWATQLHFEDHLRALQDRIRARRTLGAGAALLPIIEESPA